MKYLYRVLVLILVAAAGFMLVPVFINFMIKFDYVNTEVVPAGFLEDILQKSSIVWMISLIAGIVSLFIDQKWRYALLLCPLLLPSASLFYFAAQ